MKIARLASLLICSAAPLLADPTPKDDVTSAARKLSEQASYSWKTVVVVPESAMFKPGPTEGKTEKGGYTQVTMNFGDRKTELALKGAKAAVMNQDGEWQLGSELEQAEGPGRFLGWIAKNFKNPADEAAELAAATKEMKKDGDTYSSPLSDDGAKAQVRFGSAKDAKASVKFWMKDGVLSKYEFKVQGKVDLGGNEIDLDRTTTVEIKDLGATKVEVAEAARKKLG